MGDRVSFIYAEKTIQKNGDQEYPSLRIMGDTKFTPVLDAPNIKNWGKRTFDRLSRYGIIKSMIVAPKCCVSFAGNDISYAHDLLKFIYTEKHFSEEQLTSKAFELHSSAPQNAIEFLICCIDDNEQENICCIKDGQVTPHCPQAWIGSKDAYTALQSQRNFNISKAEQTYSLSQFQAAIESCGDDSVGGYITNIRYDYHEKTFVYSERLESHTGRDQIVQPGECIRLYDNAANGGYLVYYYESPSVFALSIDQGDFSIVYSNGTKYAEPDSLNDHTKYFMIPVLMRTSTWEPLAEIISIEN